MITEHPAPVAIVVLNWNGAADSIACLKSLEALTYGDFRVVIVDNGSSDDSLTALRTYRAPYRLELIETGRNLGYAGGNNVGVRHALVLGVRFVLVLNNDTIVAPDLLNQLMAATLRCPDAGVFSAPVMYFDDPDRVWFDGASRNEANLKLEWPGQGKLESELPSSDHDTDYSCGAALCFRAEVAEQICLLDESFFLVWEEVDWCFRACKAGWCNVVVASAKVWHKIGVYFGSESSPLRTYFSVRNGLLWFSRHATTSARRRQWGKICAAWSRNSISPPIPARGWRNVASGRCRTTSGPGLVGGPGSNILRRGAQSSTTRADDSATARMRGVHQDDN